jgi:hypothetical protein
MIVVEVGTMTSMDDARRFHSRHEDVDSTRASNRPASRQGVMGHDERFDPAALLTREFWEERYRSSDQIWSGNPN